ncbi:MAG: DUF2442 domain-containing protein [Flavobacteriales bacterium]|jgi:hypothetical protein|nr:DUF2442 domain-containing protein [Flavobacteriales bacterium]
MKDSTDFRSSDSFERLILEGKLRIKDVHVNKETDRLVVILSSGSVIATSLSDHAGLRNGSEKALNNWRLIGSGIGIQWEELDEDLSLKGLVTQVVLRQLGASGNELKVAV